MKSRARFFLVYLLLLGAALFVHLHEDLTVPSSRPLGEIPIQQGEWKMVHQAQFGEEVLAVLKPTSYLARTYQDGEGRRVSLYLGYHGGGPGSGAIHSPKHCLPGGGWSLLDEKRLELPVDGGKVSLVRALYQNGDEKELFFYWYQVRGRTLSSEYALKLAEVMNSVLHNRRDSAFVRLSIHAGRDQDEATGLGERFIGEFYPAIAAVLPR